MNNLVNIATGPLVVSTGVLTFGFNNKLAEWYTNLKQIRKTNDGALIRSAEARKHGCLLTAGSIGLASIPLSALSRVRPAGKLALAGVACGSAATIGAAVINEWDKYTDKSKVVLTGGSLLGVLAAALYV